MLEYQQLDPRLIRDLEERSRATALLPRVAVDLGYHGDRQRRRDDNQAFSTRAIRDLLDTTRDSDRGYDASLQLVWRLDEHLDPERAQSLASTAS